MRPCHNYGGQSAGVTCQAPLLAPGTNTLVCVGYLPDRHPCAPGLRSELPSDRPPAGPPRHTPPPLRIALIILREQTPPGRPCLTVGAACSLFGKMVPDWVPSSLRPPPGPPVPKLRHHHRWAVRCRGCLALKAAKTGWLGAVSSGGLPGLATGATALPCLGIGRVRRTPP